MSAIDVPHVGVGDRLLTILGHRSDAPDVQAALREWARGMEPELDPEDDEALADWVTVNELGLEFGFEDEAYVLARDPSERRLGPLLATQVYFYGESERMRAFPFALPFGLALSDDRASVRAKLAKLDAPRRSYTRDAWLLPHLVVIVAYDDASGVVQSVLCHLPHTPWPLPPNEVALASAFTPETFAQMYGARWSDPALRTRLAPLGFEAALPDVRRAHDADLRDTHGIALMFAPASKVPAATTLSPKTLCFVGVTYYASRQLDAREWAGPLPRGLSFGDTQLSMREKVGRAPDLSHDGNLSGTAVWHEPEFSLLVEYSNAENRLLEVTLYAPGFWRAADED